MGGVVNSVVEVGSFGLVDDFTGQEAAAEAAKQAGQIQQDAALRAEQGIDRRFDQSMKLLKPQINAGDKARIQQMKLLGMRGADQQQAAYDKIIESPAQKFIRERAQKNLLQNAAAMGGIGGGNVRNALVEQGAGFAMQDIDNQFARLSGLSASGANAAVNAGNMGMNAANASGDAIMNAGQAQAGGILGAAQADAQATGQIMQLAGTAIGAFAGGPGGAAIGGQAGASMAPQVPQGGVMGTGYQYGVANRNPLTLF